MKGTPSEPRCKFSRAAVEALTRAGAGAAGGPALGSVDVLSSPAVRQGLKDKFDWPTFPMAFLAGAFVGGVDVLAEMEASGDLARAVAALAAPAAGAAAAAAAASPPPPPLPREAAVAATAAAAAAFTGLTPALEARLRALVSRAPAVLFMKGSPAAPQCGFSDKVVRLLREHGVPLAAPDDTFDIFTDQAVREGLKVLFSWPTFPQLYVRGELVGGLDVLREMAAEDPTRNLAQQLGLA